MTFENSKHPRDNHGRWAPSGGSAGATSQIAKSPVGTTSTSTTLETIGTIAAESAVGVAALALAPMALRTLGSLAVRPLMTMAGIEGAKVLGSAAVGGSVSTMIMTRLAGARLGSLFGLPGAIVGGLLAPAIEQAITPNPVAVEGLALAPALISKIAGATTK